MRGKLFKRLRSRAGETIAETLVALLISAVGLLLLAGMIASSDRLITRSKHTMDAYYDGNNSVAAQTDVSETGTGTVTIEVVDPLDNLREQTFNVVYYVNNELGNTPVISYKIAD